SAADDLDEVLAWREERTVTKNLTLHYDRMMLILEPTPLARGLVRKKVAVVNYPDGRFAVQFEGTPLEFRVFDKIRTVLPGDIVENKRLSAVLEQVKAQQAAYPPKRQRGHVARQRPPKGVRRASLAFRYVTENRYAERPQTSGRDTADERRTPGAISCTPASALGPFPSASQ